ncbi:MAG: HAD-IA family hydrolase [Rhodobacteraceae bacterium]|nr:HAD-IA family hydrolase [Paracoccaceae bacterium]
MSARIVFDLDGTLIDSAPDIRNIANAALKKIGFAPISLQETHSFIGEGIQVFVEKMRQARDVPDTYQDDLLDDLVARYDDAVELTEMYPGVSDSLQDLSGRHTLGICTNKLYRPCIAVLEHLDIAHHFSTVWGGDNRLARKPDPAPLLAAFAELGAGPCLYVGDSEVDAQTARRADVPFILFTQGYRKSPVDDIPHTVALDDFRRLPDLVETVLARD